MWFPRIFLLYLSSVRYDAPSDLPEVPHVYRQSLPEVPISASDTAPFRENEAMYNSSTRRDMLSCKCHSRNAGIADGGRRHEQARPAGFRTQSRDWTRYGGVSMYHIDQPVINPGRIKTRIVFRIAQSNLCLLRRSRFSFLRYQS